MDKLLFVWNGQFFYWNAFLIAAAAAGGLCCLISLYLRIDGFSGALAAFIPAAMWLSVILSRLIHWYCLPNQYESVYAAMTQLDRGNYALLGCFAGCILTALLLRAVGIIPQLLPFLDCLSVAGCGSIAVGRLAFLYSPLDKGPIVSIQKFPFSVPVLNAVSGAAEYRFASFLFQAVFVGMLFAALLVSFRRAVRKGRGTPGDITLLFLLVYGAIEIILDSTRYDSLYFRSNGFVSVVQVLGAVSIVACAVIYSIRGIRNTGMKIGYIPMWVLLLAAAGGAGYMEYYVQRHGREALFAYSVMGGCLIGYVVLVLILRHWAVKSEDFRR